MSNKKSFINGTGNTEKTKWRNDSKSNKMLPMLSVLPSDEDLSSTGGEMRNFIMMALYRPDLQTQIEKQ